MPRAPTPPAPLTRAISAGPDAPNAPNAHDTLESSEWLLTNGLGGFAMGSALGTPTRRYHAWLIAALTPPVGRIVALHSVAETLILDADPHANQNHPEQRLEFSTYNFKGARRHPAGYQLLTTFEKDLTCRWTYRWGKITFIRELALLRDQNAAVIRYRIGAEGRRARLELRPLVAMRDFHSLLSAPTSDQPAEPFRITTAPGTLSVAHDTDTAPRLGLACNTAREIAEPQWWRNFEYDQDRLRGQDFTEDLFSPGRFIINLEPRPPATPSTTQTSTQTVELLAWVETAGTSTRANNAVMNRPRGDLDHELDDERWRLAQLTDAAIKPNAATKPDAESEEARRRRLGSLQPLAAADRARLALLIQAADQFVVGREPSPITGRATTTDPAQPTSADTTNFAPFDTSIIAGYPWFSDWGRDAMIALPGLLLSTARFYEAQRLLKAFARHAKNGLIPNNFDDLTGRAEYNTADASLWFIHAACAFLRTSSDRRAFDGPIRQTCLQIIDAYRAGTDFNIRMDPADGLISAGDASTQLTWMDARRDGVVFTPRHGKPVEINALWYSVLLDLAGAIDPDQPRTARDLRQLADKAGRSFRDQFWNDAASCLFDVLTPDPASPTGWRPDPRLRPNQVFAVSLPHSALSPDQQTKVVATLRDHLLTPLGLRTLDPADPGYKPRYEGTLFDRDAAYHNGTVWPFLIGPYAEALLRTGHFSPDARARARAALQPLLDELTTRSLGTLPEIYDADPLTSATGAIKDPRRPQGCIAQAWSIAELLRTWLLTLTPDQPTDPKPSATPTAQSRR